jgi:hypothetical protein
MAVLKDTPYVVLFGGPHNGRLVPDPLIQYHEDDILVVCETETSPPTSYRIDIDGFGRLISSRAKCTGQRHIIWVKNLVEKS